MAYPGNFEEDLIDYVSSIDSTVAAIREDIGRVTERLSQVVDKLTDVESAVGYAEWDPSGHLGEIARLLKKIDRNTG